MSHITDVVVLCGIFDDSENGVLNMLNDKIASRYKFTSPFGGLIVGQVNHLDQSELAREIQAYPWKDPALVRVLIGDEYESGWRDFDWAGYEETDGRFEPTKCTDDHCSLFEGSKVLKAKMQEANTRLPSERQDALTVIARTFGRDWEACLREIQAMILRDPALRREMENSTPHPNYVELALRYPGPWWKRAANT